MISNIANEFIKQAASMDDFKEMPHTAGPDIELHDPAQRTSKGKSSGQKFKQAYEQAKRTAGKKVKGISKTKAALGLAAAAGTAYGAKALYDKYKAE